ncbi:hypothetical protein DFS34DRAFT_649285 [Phlyctochytrium arcticum]|nr:hypothetical protein DFS34DRAFT_649285 [Phlyctochytrium arcticum]
MSNNADQYMGLAYNALAAEQPGPFTSQLTGDLGDDPLSLSGEQMFGQPLYADDPMLQKQPPLLYNQQQDQSAKRNLYDASGYGGESGMEGQMYGSDPSMLYSPGDSDAPSLEGSTVYDRANSFDMNMSMPPTQQGLLVSRPLGGGQSMGNHQQQKMPALPGYHGGKWIGNVDLEEASLRAQPEVLKVVTQFSAYLLDATFIPRPITAFDDLPPVPDTFILNELISVYFERLPPTIAVLQEEAFYRSASRPPIQPNKGPPMRPPFHHNPPQAGLSPVLLFSMLACAARYHPLYSDQHDMIQKVFYERGKRLMLPDLERPSLDLLKALLHLSLFAVEHSLWMEAYMWLGTSVTMARFLGLYKEMPAIAAGQGANGGIGAEEEAVGGLSLQQIMAEESRRCWWWLRNYDASGSAASKRPQMISDAEYASSLLLPCPDSLFYATRYGLQSPTPTVPRTQTLDEFFSDTFAADLAHSSIGPNGYLAALTALFNRVTRFRQHCNTINVLPFAPGDYADPSLAEELARHQRELEMWYDKLPQWVQVLDSGVRDDKTTVVGGGMCWQDRWMRETYEWGIALVTWHATFATLHGPDYNMMTIGNQIAGSFKLPSTGGVRNPPPHIAAGFLSSARLDQVLQAWQHSPSFDIAVEHAGVATNVLAEMAAKVPPAKRRDTPFFGYCCCQIGLLNLIAARQIAFEHTQSMPSSPAGASPDSPSPATAEPPSSSTTTSSPYKTPNYLQSLATTAIQTLQHQSPQFSASKTGMNLLHQIMLELAGGQITMNVMQEMENKGMTGRGDWSIKEALMRRATSRTAREVLEDPGKCAGTMGVGGVKFGTVL